MDAREKIFQSLMMFKDSSRNNHDSLGLTREIIRNKYIKNRLKLHLPYIIDAMVQTNLFSKEAIQNFIEIIEMKIDKVKNDKDLKNASGYQLNSFLRDENNEIIRENRIVINKKGGINDNVIAHEAVHGIAQSNKFVYEDGKLAYAAGFRKSFYNDNLEFTGSYGTAFNEGFTEIATAMILNNIGNNKIKTKINGIKQSIHEAMHIAKGKGKGIIRNSLGKDRTFNPYGFEYDKYDRNQGGGSYTVYKKMAELLNYASDKKAFECFVKGDLDKFMQDFDSIRGEGYCKNLLSHLDAFHSNYEYLYNKYEKGEIKNYKDIFKDEYLQNNIQNSSDSIVEYFSKNLQKQLSKDTKASDFISKLTQFEKMLPKAIDRTVWMETKDKLLFNFMLEKGATNFYRDSKENFAALNVYYDDCLNNNKNAKKGFEYQTVFGLKDLNESTMIVNKDGQTSIFSIDLSDGYKSYTCEELLMDNLNSKKRLTPEEREIKEKLNERFLHKKKGMGIKKKPQYLTCQYYEDYVFVNNEDGISAYNILRNEMGIELQEMQLSEIRQVCDDKQGHNKAFGEQCRIKISENINSLTKKLEDRYMARNRVG